MVKIYRNGENLGLMTDSDSEETFVRDFTAVFSAAMKKDPKLALQPVLVCFADVVAKLRGYKSNVRTRTLIEAGIFVPDDEDLIAAVDGHDVLKEN